MSLRALPLILIVVILYNVVVFWGGVEALDKELFKLPLPSGVAFPMKISDLLMVVMLVTLFIELLKATWTSTASLLDHGLSMLVFVLCLVEFIVVTRCAPATFFFIPIAPRTDVRAGYPSALRAARRDLSIGGNN